MIKEKNKVLKKINFEIKYGQSVAFFGSTGVGKSTIVDLLLGLYKPQKGEILIDNIKLNDANIPSWQKKIGYVPQEIYIVDDTIKNNIAFGVDTDSIDNERIIELSKLVNLHKLLRMNYQKIIILL